MKGNEMSAYNEILTALESRFPKRTVITLYDAAAVLECNPQTVRRMYLRGDLPGIKVGKSDRSPVKFRLPVLARWMAEREGDTVTAKGDSQ